MPVSVRPPGRAPFRPWAVRLGGWLLALGLLIVAAIVLVERGSYGATEHTIASSPPAELSGQPADTLAPESNHDTDSYVAGPVIASIGEHGVVAFERTTGEELWRYQRTDAPVCAHHVTAKRIILVYGAADRCNEAISLEPAGGVRQWQRTLEAVHPNEIVMADDMFLSVDPAKVIAYETNQGYERFTLDNSLTNHIAGEHTTCENLQAAGAPIVATIQRCRATETEPWLVQLVINAASEGKPRETGRSYLNELNDPQLVGVADEGTTFVRDAAGAVHVLLPGAGEVVPVNGLPALAPDEPLQLLAIRGTTVLSTLDVAYYLDAGRTNVTGTSDLVAAPYVDGTLLYIPTPTGIEVRDGFDGALQRTLSWPAQPSPPAEIVVSGPLIGLRDADGLQVFS